jgi:hypothetical protein
VNCRQANKCQHHKYGGCKYPKCVPPADNVLPFIKFKRKQ